MTYWRESVLVWPAISSLAGPGPGGNPVQRCRLLRLDPTGVFLLYVVVSRDANAIGTRRANLFRAFPRNGNGGRGIMSERQMGRFSDGLALLVTVLVGLSAAGVGLAAEPPKDRLAPNERVIEPKVNVLDKDEINTPESKLWVLHFIFKDPRVITVDIPGRGRRVCWYLPYYVVNKTKEPHTFIPDFELVADDKDTVHMDQILPSAQDAIIKLEDPTNYLKTKNSVQMAATPIPPSKENADPTRVAGVAIWDDVDPETSHFYIYVSGLSNGWSVTDPPAGEKDPAVRP